MLFFYIPTLEDELAMAQLSEALNPNEMEPGRAGFEVIPGGWYQMQIIESSCNVNKNGTGEVMKLTWEVQDGKNDKARVFDNINYLHENPVTQNIGQGMVKNICDAIGYTDRLIDTDVLMHQSCWVKIGIEAAKNGYPEKNKIFEVKPYDPAGPPVAAKPAAKGATTATSAQKAAVAAKPAGVKTAAAAPPGAQDRPWLRNKQPAA